MHISGKNGPIFIVGSPRSGTTLLQYMLRSHPRISLPTGESHFVVPLYRNAAKFGDLGHPENIRRILEAMYLQSAEFLDTDLHGMQFDIDVLAKEFHAQGLHTVPQIIAGLFKKNAQGEGKERWGDKTPYYVLHLKIIKEMFPDAQIIHLIRDGRDCALSMLERKHDFNVYNVYHAAKYWEQYVERGQTVGRDLGPDAYMEIRYEDILKDPEASVRTVCSFLGEDYNDAIVNFEKSTESGNAPLLQNNIQKNNAEKWRSKMTSHQIGIFESAVGNSLLRNGYTLASRGMKLPLPLRAAFRFHNNLLTWWSAGFRKKASRV